MNKFLSQCAETSHSEASCRLAAPLQLWVKKVQLPGLLYKGPSSNLQSLPPLKFKTRFDPSRSGTSGLQLHPAQFLLALQFLNGLPWGPAGRILHYQSRFATGSLINMASAPWQLSQHPTRVLKAELKVNITTTQVAGRRVGECWKLKSERKGYWPGPQSFQPGWVPSSWAGCLLPPAIGMFYTSHQCHHSWHLIMHQRWKWTGTKHPNFPFSYYFCIAPWSWELIKSCGTDNQCLFCWVKLHYIQMQKKKQRENNPSALSWLIEYVRKMMIPN